jgi:hypothetical protein
MVTTEVQPTLYRCDICKHYCNSEDGAKKCESQGLPPEILPAGSVFKIDIHHQRPATLVRAGETLLDKIMEKDTLFPSVDERYATYTILQDFWRISHEGHRNEYFATRLYIARDGHLMSHFYPKVTVNRDNLTIDWHCDDNKGLPTLLASSEVEKYCKEASPLRDYLQRILEGQ